MATHSRSGRSSGRSSGGARSRGTRPTGWSPRLAIGSMVLPLFMAAAVMLGGASAAGTLPNMLLQVIAVAILWLTAIRTAPRVLTTAERLLIGLACSFVVLVMLTLVPLPPSFWPSLPGRAPIAAEFRMLGSALPWLPLTLTPHATVAGLLALTVAAAAAALVSRATDPGLGYFAWAVVAVAAVSVMIGFLQLVSGGQSPLYLYSVTNRGQSVGFFANSNHLATLELVAIPLLTALAAQLRSGDGAAEGQAGNVVVIATLAVVLLLGVAINGSLAGLGLLLPVLIGCLLLFRGGRSRRIALIAFAAALAIVAGFIMLSLNSPVISGYAATSFDAGPTSRLSFVQHSADAIATYFPFGSGLGSFVAVFPAFEDASKVGPVFVNHAHNDYVELVLELGLPGVVLIAGFLGWWSWRVVAIWRDRASSLMLRAATISTAVVLAHSLVDYPLRTAAIMAIFAACCAVMARPGRVRPVTPPVQVRDETIPAARHLSA